MEDTNQPRLDQWTDFAGKYLKAQHIATFPIILICRGISSYFDEEENPHLILDFTHAGKKWKWEANITNRNLLKELGKCMPSQLKDRRITFTKHQVMNPTTKQRVDSLLVEKVE